MLASEHETLQPQECPNPRRVRIFLAEKRVTLPIEEIEDIETGLHRAPEFRAKNSLAQLPVLELDDGTTLTESVAICRYFEEMVPEPPLFGRSTIERAQVEMWNRRMEIELLLPTIDVFVHTHPFWQGKREQMPEWGARQQAHLVERMRWLDGELEGPVLHRHRPLQHRRHHRPGGAAHRAGCLRAADSRRSQEPGALVGRCQQAADGTSLGQAQQRYRGSR